MNRFIGLMWDIGEGAASQQAAKWRTRIEGSSTNWRAVVDAPGLVVLSLAGRSPAICSLEGATGIIVGHLFERGREASGPRLTIPPSVSARIMSSKGKQLLDAYWGNYVALWRDADGPASFVLRDPCGGLPCFHLVGHGVAVTFSSIADVAHLPDLPLSLNRAYLRSFIENPYVVTPDTGILGVSELLPGERLRVAGGCGVASELLWRPVDVAERPVGRSEQEARAELRSIANDCFTGWGASFDRIAIRLSGGVDSSVVLGLMRRLSRAEITAIHSVAHDYEAYEWRLAHLTSERAGVRLTEIRIDPTHQALDSILDEPLLARPTRQLLGLHTDAAILQACEEIDADVVMAGHGGDSLFMQKSLMRHSFADYLRVVGPWGSLKAAYDTATLLEQPVFSVLADGVGAAIKRQNRMSSARASRNPVLSKSASVEHDPRREGLLRLPPCKRDQVGALLNLVHYVGLRGVHVALNSVNPLISQPLLEWSLRTPTHVMASGGLDRALERRAFHDVIPPEVRRRQGKGFVNHNLLTMIRQNLTFLRHVVLAGTLVSEGVVNAIKAEQALSVEALADGQDLDFALGVIVAEAWVAGWRKSGVLSNQ